eukprot:CAMPEP_0198727222 /NCGR_PEP_ID=MMETSP1475-20131203/4013_1 /TAXON_ID= ORGANISM="Unidentified sp., Strain CCMP1999" /NCGR_SAMPLE_ID=MMETSP1475 /ASSEMBLY_ACC=CAM_ASM_001111 /LENGTH=250 /DNA_ID=CAMNT_0044489231 /DNA_START=344 /DNA_END=1096 /DNA_ORIENTATION=-
MAHSHVAYSPMQSCANNAQSAHFRPIPMMQPVHHQISPSMTNSNSPVLSLCSGTSEYSPVPTQRPPVNAAPINPGLSLLCRAVEEAHSTSEKAGRIKNAEAPRVKGPWRAEEDKLLCELVEKFGPRRWTAIASFIAGRTGKQSRERWLNHLNPDLSKRPWTDAEDKIIMKAHAELGNKWSEIAKRLKGRTDNSVKNRFNTTIRRQISEYSSLMRTGTPKRAREESISSEENEDVKRHCSKDVVQDVKPTK